MRVTTKSNTCTDKELTYDYRCSAECSLDVHSHEFDETDGWQSSSRPSINGHFGRNNRRAFIHPYLNPDFLRRPDTIQFIPQRGNSSRSRRVTRVPIDIVVAVARMGICNSSTKQDIQRDRQRTQTPPPLGTIGHDRWQQEQAQAKRQGGAQSGAAGPIPASGRQQQQQGLGFGAGSYRDAQGIPRSLARDQPLGTSYKSDGDGGVYGTSYTNRKTREYDLLNDIVKQTRGAFIDVSAKGGTLDEDDLLERGQKYVNNLADIPLHAQATPNAAAAASFGPVYHCLELPPPYGAIVGREDGGAESETSTSSRRPSGLSSSLAHTHHARFHSQSQSLDSNSQHRHLQLQPHALIGVLAHASIPQQDIEFISSASAQLANVILDNCAMPDPNLKIVLSFEEMIHDNTK